MPLTNDAASRERKAKKDRACDACRRRKTKCDGSSMHNHVCSNCMQSRKPCTYVEASKPRGPSKAYITNLEDRVEALEALIRQLRPNHDFSDELGPPVVRGSWKNQDGSLDASSASYQTNSPIAHNVLPPLLIPYYNRKDSGPSQPQAKVSPRSTHLIFRSKPPSKSMRMRVDVTDGFSSSSEESSDDASSSSEQVEETVITSLVGREKITLFASENDDTPEENNIRFHGRSSTAGLIETTRQFKHMHMRDTVNSPEEISSEEKPPNPVIPDNLTVSQWRRPIFWQRPVWEYSHETQRVESLDRLQTFLEYFPPADLASTLINLYFRNSNQAFPLLHRPTFDRQWKEQLHHRNIWFAGVCLMIFAIGSRWCEDPRILPEIPREGEIDWRQAGRQYFQIVVEIHLIRDSLLHPTNLFEVQTVALMGMYLRGTAAFPSAWIVISVGLRKVQDVGAHRKKVYRAEPNIDDELWKRAFWLLVALDRIGGVGLGRACGISEEDFDLDLPLEVDDEYWETDSKQFKQPPGVPSTLTAFVQLIKLTQIMAFTMRTLYAINKSKVYYGVTPLDRKSITKQVSLAMTEWLERLPEHLRWHDKIENSTFLAQSAFLMALYHLTEMLIWRPLIAIPHPQTSPRSSSSSNSAELSPIPSLTDPAILRCTEAAHACARIVEVQLRRGLQLFTIPGIINVSYVCSGLLLVNAWNLKIREKQITTAVNPDVKPPLASRIERDVADAKVFLRALEEIKDRWEVVDVLLDELSESLAGLELSPYNQDVARSDSLKKSRSRSSIRAPHIVQYMRDDSDNINYTRPSSSIHTYIEPVIPPVYDSHGISYQPFADSKPSVQLRIPGALPDLDSGRASEIKLHSSTNTTSAPVNNHTLMNLPIGAPSWRERSIPYISTMRRASSSNLRTHNDLRLGQDNDPLNARPPLQPPESAVRYDDGNLNSDDRMYSPRYQQQDHHQHSPFGPSGGSYERAYHRMDGSRERLIHGAQSETLVGGGRGWQTPTGEPQYPHGVGIALREDRHTYAQDLYSSSESQ